MGRRTGIGASNRQGAKRMIFKKSSPWIFIPKTARRFMNPYKREPQMKQQE